MLFLVWHRQAKLADGEPPHPLRIDPFPETGTETRNGDRAD
jgi:hypothetical protein